MILSYSFFHFERAIQDGAKLHTFRRDPHNRWREGMSIQHWMGSPRNPRTSHPFDGPPTCKGVQDVFMQRKSWFPNCGLKIAIRREQSGENAWYDVLTDEQAAAVARNDGFPTVAEFRDYFLPEGTDIWRGRIIHFTTLKY